MFVKSLRILSHLTVFVCLYQTFIPLLNPFHITSLYNQISVRKGYPLNVNTNLMGMIICIHYPQMVFMLAPIRSRLSYERKCATITNRHERWMGVVHHLQSQFEKHLRSHFIYNLMSSKAQTDWKCSWLLSSRILWSSSFSRWLTKFLLSFLLFYFYFLLFTCWF